MRNDLRGEIIFWGATFVALAVYLLTAPSGLPWNGSMKLAMAWAGQIVELPEMEHPVWGYFIRMFGGHFVTLSALVAAVSAGLIGAMVNRYLGWRVGVAAALVWMTLPWVWDGALTGSHRMFWIGGAVLAVWLGNALFLVLTQRARALRSVADIEAQEAQQVAKDAQAQPTEVEKETRRMRLQRNVAWCMLGLAVAFAVASASWHDYQQGEVAAEYARQILDEAGDRIIVLNGVADEQIIWEAERRAAGSSARLITLRNDDAYRSQLVARVHHAWPTATNLWVAAQVGVDTFADLVAQQHADRVYVMTGASTTLEKWSARWAAMGRYLKSRDIFVPYMRRAFAFEGNTLGNRLQHEGRLQEAWHLYWRILDEIEGSNVSAWVNLGEMLRRGYAAEPNRRQCIEDVMASLHKGLATGRAAERSAAIVAACGPVMPDSAVLSEYQVEARRRLAELEKDATGWQMPKGLRTLTEWNDEMLKAHDRGHHEEAVRIARTILSRREWRSFIPANAVMGAEMAHVGDYVTAEAFYRMVVLGKEKPPAVICNDYADTLRHLGRFEEAERYARLAVAQAGGLWLYRLTLAEVLRDAGKNADEVRELVKVLRREMPMHLHARFLEGFTR